jgi:hypothetical protein
MLARPAGHHEGPHRRDRRRSRSGNNHVRLLALRISSTLLRAGYYEALGSLKNLDENLQKLFIGHFAVLPIDVARAIIFYSSHWGFLP